MIKRLAAGAVAVAALTLSTLAVDVGTASAAPCSSTKNPSVRGGEAGWSVRCVSSRTTIVNGWVKDTKADGKCAHVVIFFPDGNTKDVKACPKGTKREFSYPTTGTDVQVELRVY